MIIGSTLSVPDNDSYMLDGVNGYPRCVTCGLLSDVQWVNPGFKLNARQFDASYTYDGFLIVSDRFRSITKGNALFLQLPNDAGFYSLVVRNQVPFDSVRRQTRFENPCGECGRFFSVAGATPIFLVTPRALADELFRTDVEFGTGNEQHPRVVMGNGLAEQLRAAHLSGVTFLPVRGQDNP